jgi:hypothetical protein
MGVFTFFMKDYGEWWEDFHKAPFEIRVLHPCEFDAYCVEISCLMFICKREAGNADKIMNWLRGTGKMPDYLSKYRRMFGVWEIVHPEYMKRFKQRTFTDLEKYIENKGPNA